MFGNPGSLVWENYPAHGLSGGGTVVGRGDKSATTSGFTSGLTNGFSVESVDTFETSIKNIENTKSRVRNVSTRSRLATARSSSEGLEYARRECTICGKSMSEKYLGQHMERHDVERKYSCDTCNRAFRTQGDLYSHSKIHTNASDMYECKLCEKKFRRKEYLIQHELVHKKDNKIYKCLLCGNAFHTSKLLTSHQKNMHPSLNAGIKSTNADGCSVTTRSCPVVEHSSTRSTCVDNSATGKENTGEKLSETISGYYNMPTPYSYQASYLSGSTVVDCNSTGGRAIDDVGVEAADMSEAVSRDADNAKYRANNIGEQSGSATIQTFCHDGGGKECDICGSILSSSSKLIDHKRRHADARPHACDICCKSFKVKRDLAAHKKQVHNDECPFLCTVCGRSFKYRSVLKNHEMTHSGGKNLKCQHCGKCFKVQRYLSTHISTVHPEKSPYKCHLCSRAFHGAVRLKCHIALHQNPQIDECSYYREAASSGNESVGCAQEKHHRQQTGVAVANADGVFVTNQSLPVINQPSTSGAHVDESEIRWKCAGLLNEWRDTLLDLSPEELDHMFC